MNRREFLQIASAGATGMMAGGVSAGTAEQPTVKFLLMADTHVESDFVERGHPVYTMWQPGNHAALVKTYAFINEDPFCRDLQFALFAGDQINTGYTRCQTEREAERANYFRTLGTLDLYRESKGSDLSSFRFHAPNDFLCAENLPPGMKPFRMAYPPFDSRVIAIQGNHDTGVPEFWRECAFSCADTRFICFFAAYIGLPAAPGHYLSTASISNEALAFIEREMSAAAADPSIRHLVLCSHWAIAPKGPDFVCPIVDACRENKFNDNRRKLLALAEKYGCDLFLNGHEHNGNYPVGQVGTLADINCGTVTGTQGAWAVVEIFPRRAVFTIYSRAAAAEKADASGHASLVFTQQPRRLFTRTISLHPIR